LRDAWITTVTKELLGTGLPSAARLLRFKEAVAGEFAPARSLWIQAEKPVRDGIDYHFGFAVPKPGMGTGESETPVLGPGRRPKPAHDVDDRPVATAADLETEPALLERAKKMGRSKDRRDRAVRNAIEAWSLADPEAWKSARAFLTRAHVERLNWETAHTTEAGQRESAPADV
jgi:hypothetical protein